VELWTPTEKITAGTHAPVVPQSLLAPALFLTTPPQTPLARFAGTHKARSSGSGRRVFLCYSQKFSLNRPQTFIDNLIVLMRRWQRLQKSPPSAGAHERDQQHHRPDDGAGDVTPQFAVGIIPTSEKQ
jgi:hypothetical protein